MYQKQLTIKLNERSPLYQNLCAVAQQEGTSGLYALLENNLLYVVNHQYNRLPVQPLCSR